MTPAPFEARFGFPRRAVSLANWRRSPFSRWSFQHARELVPTASMSAARPEPNLGAERLSDPAVGSVSSLNDPVLEAQLIETATDVLLVLKHGRPVLAWSAPHGDLRQPHILFSVSKSLTGLLAGALEGAGVVDLAAPVVDYVPEARDSAFGDATLRHLLDMRVAMVFDEVYGDDWGWGARYCRAVLWDPQEAHAPESHLDVLLSIAKSDEAHGGPFRYRSANTDMLGVALARATGRPLAELMRDHLWTPLGAQDEAYVTLDREGTAQAAGGMAVSARDLARVGEMMRQAGTLDGARVLPERFVEDTLRGGDRRAWHAGDFAPSLPGGSYRNQWYLSHRPDGTFHAQGIHGQWLHMNPARDVTVVKLSSQPDAKADEASTASLRLIEWVGERV